MTEEVRGGLPKAIQDLVEWVRHEIAASETTVSAGFSPEAWEDIHALVNRLVEEGTVERGVAEKAVDRMILTRRPDGGHFSLGECIVAVREDMQRGV